MKKRSINSITFASGYKRNTFVSITEMEVPSRNPNCLL